MEDNMENRTKSRAYAAEKNLSLKNEKIILVGIFDVPQQGILLVQRNNGQLELPGGSIFKNFDLRSLTGQQIREITLIQKVIYEKSGFFIKVKSLIANFHFPQKNKIFKVFLLDKTESAKPNPNLHRNPSSKIFFIKKDQIPDHSNIKSADHQILLDYIKREKQIKRRANLHSPFTSIITID